MKRALGVIPARYGSTRFPGKILASLGGRPLVEHVWRGVARSSRLERVVIATDDARIFQACRAFGAEVAMTSPDHASGTDRVAEVVARSGVRYDVVVNVQGDEPFVTGSCLDRLVEALSADPALSMATLWEPFDDPSAVSDPNAVKVVCGLDGRALYFSRSPIPFDRTGSAGLALWRRHQGIYAYRAEALFEITALPPSPLERAESLEQLRALQAGYAIAVLPSDFRSIAVDTPEDLARAEARLSTLEEAGR